MTNITTESNQIAPSPVIVATALATKAIERPSATGNVHGRAPPAKRSEGAGEERPSRPRQHRNREHHRQPPEELLEAGIHAAVVVACVQRDAQQHHLHPEQGGDAEPPDAGAALRLDGRLFFVRGIGDCAISGLGKGFEQGVQACGACVEPHLGAPQREVHGGGVHPGYRREQALDQPRAPGATHPLDGEGDRARTMPGAAANVVIARAAHQRRLHLRDPPGVDLRPMAGVGGGCAVRVRMGTQPVPGRESGVRDGLDRGAAWIAAHPHLAARHRRDRRSVAEGRAAMMAAGRRRAFNRRKDFRVQGFPPLKQIRQR